MRSRTGRATRWRSVVGTAAPLHFSGIASIGQDAWRTTGSVVVPRNALRKPVS